MTAHLDITVTVHLIQERSRRPRRKGLWNERMRREPRSEVRRYARGGRRFESPFLLRGNAVVEFCALAPQPPQLRHSTGTQE